MNNSNNKFLNSKNINTILIIVISLIIIVILYNILNNNSKENTKEEIKKEDIFILIGSDVTINYNGQYIEQGCKYIDKDNNDLSNNVIITSNIDTKTPGNYTVIYSYNGKTITRNVTVLETTDYSLDINYSLNTSEYTNKDITIKYSITGKSFNKVELPNGTINNNSEGSFTISKNGTYLIKAYNEKNEIFKKEIIINNIIKEKPQGTCTLTVYDNNSIVIITPSNKDFIKGYKYYLGTEKTGITTNTTYSIKKKIKKAGITIYDKAGNYSNIECKTIDKSSTPTPKPTKTPNNSIISYTTRSYTTNSYNGVSYTLYIPSNNLNSKIPLVIYYHGAAGLKIGLPAMLQNGSNFPFYIVCPINNTDPTYTPGLINHLSSFLKIDRKRIYISGASSGTKPAINTAYQNRGLFAGAIIIASYSDTPGLNVGVPMWFFQGTNDSYNFVANIVNNINNNGGKARLTTYPGGHDAPLGAFTREDLIKWILKQ